VSISCGVLGSGWVATDRHIPSIARSSAADVTVVYDHSIANARARAPRGAVATDDLSTVFDHELDAVVICTPPWTHADLAIEALGRGCHVFCEKPMATSVADANAMAAAAAAAGRILCVSHNFLWSNAMQSARAALAESGSVRHLLAVQLSGDGRRLPAWSDQLDGGLLHDELPHVLYVASEMLGGSVEIEDVRTDWGTRTSEPRTCEILLSGSEASGSVTVVFGSPVSEWHVAVVTDRSVVDVDLFRDVTVATGSDGGHSALEVLRTSLRTTVGHVAGFAATGARRAMRRQYWGHDRLLEEFFGAVAAGGESPVSIESALAVVNLTSDVLEAIRRA
jgi:predicted dehydrogenase